MRPKKHFLKLRKTDFVRGLVMNSRNSFKKNIKMELHKNQTLKIYNTLSGEKETFTPIHKGNIGMYVCGPTVYSNVHLGNVRTFMSFDVIFRYLLH